MELLVTDQHFILLDAENSLWFNRHTQSISTKLGGDHEITSATCLGTVYGYLGNLGSGADTKLIFIRQRGLVGVLDGCEIYKILSVLSVPLEAESELILEGCTKHSPYDQNIKHDPHIKAPVVSEYTGQKNLFKVKVGAFASQLINTERVSPLLRRNDRMDKIERKILDEFHKMFTDADSFYYSLKYDLTNTVQRQFIILESKSQAGSIFQNADDRFIWNYHMLKDLVQSEDAGIPSWIIPMVHGFIEYSKCHLELDDDLQLSGVEKRDHIDLWLISRRSRFRAGTRYLRRGIDEEGKVANYVETEQIMIFQKHKTSFLQIRGSIPLYWSQSGQRYRPNPRLDRCEEETFMAFQKHFQEECAFYGPIAVINLVDKTGKEKVLGDAFLSNVLTHNSSDITYLSFDFHEHCRGMHFENVSIVIDKLEDVFNSMSYCWVDSYGIVLKQKGVLRVNCVDCLDRTNLTQTQFGRHVLEAQLSKLGLLQPEIGLAKNIKVALQTMWANNGDTISKQYAGTNALKGDFTRTGERKFTSALKDGMNSANRYYLNRFRDTYRQAAIDITMGERNTLIEDDLDEGKSSVEKEATEATVEQIRTVMEFVKKCTVPKDAVIIGAWCFVNLKKNMPGETEIDTFLILTEECCIVTEYDCSLDSVTESETIHLKYLTSMELTLERATAPSNPPFLPTNPVAHSTNPTVPCLRITRTRDGRTHCHELLSSNIQFSHDVALHIPHSEEMFEAAKLVAESVQAAAKKMGNAVKINQKEDLSKLSAALSESGSDSVDQANRSTSGNDESQTNRTLSMKNQKKPQQVFPTSALRPIQCSMVQQKGDLILASCGVIHSPNRAPPYQLTSFNSIPMVKSNFEISSGVRTPAATTPIDVPTRVAERIDSPEEYQQHDQNILFRHRSSLPSNSISVQFNNRSVTPEIKITEVPQNTLSQLADLQNSKLGVPTMSKRVSRSTEEISSDHESDEHKSSSGLGDPSLSTSFSKDNRSSSIQNLFNSALNMRSSRSENTITARPQSSRAATSINPLSKESMMAPLGKLARGMQKGATYFDPRKLKDTFKPVAKNLLEEVHRKEDKEYLLALEEKKKHCKSAIIEI